MDTPQSPTYAGAPEHDAGVDGDRRKFLVDRVSWGAILAGVAAALVIQLLLNLLGVGVGAWALDAGNTADNPGVGSFSIGAVVWWAVAGILASLAGGAVAGRLSGAARTGTAQWHGFVTWATTTLVVLWLLTTTVGGLLGGALNTVGGALSGAGKAAASAVSDLAQNTGGGSGLQAQVRQLVNPDQTQNVQDSVIAYVRARVSGDQQAADKARDQAINGVAQAAKISPDEARTRVDQLVQQAQQAADQARQRATQAAETARKGVGTAGLAGFIALVLGAVAGFFGGGLGARRRTAA